jgi:5-methylcytosine-specific restriction endonuclease McrA
MPGYHRWAPEAERNKYYDVLRRWDINFDLGYAGGHLWETHHKVAISEGGGGPITVDDLATACWKCHPKLTGELRRRLNRAKGVKKP